MKPFTTCVHAGAHVEPTTGAIMQPIFATSTYVQEEPGKHKGFDYSRADNPTRQAYEEALATLEGARHGLSFASGLAAVQAVIQLLDPGSRILVCDDVYGGIKPGTDGKLEATSLTIGKPPAKKKDEKKEDKK